jgi:hypothetical protein
MDEEMGRLMHLLAELGIEDNTLLIFSSDHGDLLGAHGWFNKRAPWNESILVPMIMRYPNGIKAGQKDPSPLSGVDIAPTLLGFAGVNAPEEMDGTDFSGYIMGRSNQAPESAFLIGIAPDNISEQDWQQHLEKRKMAYDWRGLYTGAYTYTLRRENGKIVPWMLYDNDKDTYQMTNLVNDPSYKTIINGLQKQLNQYLASVMERDWLLLTDILSGNWTGHQALPGHMQRFTNGFVKHFQPDQSDPVWMDYYTNYIFYLYGLGVDAIHRDDPVVNSNAPRSGGTFTPSSVEYFRNYLERNFTSEELLGLGVEDIARFNVRDHFRMLGAPSDNTLWQWRGSPLMAVYRANPQDEEIQDTCKGRPPAFG